MKSISRNLFWLSVWVGRPFGGLRPRRLTHWLAHRGFTEDDVRSDKAYSIKTKYGNQLKGHPFYALDREVLIQGC